MAREAELGLGVNPVRAPWRMWGIFRSLDLSLRELTGWRVKVGLLSFDFVSLFHKRVFSRVLSLKRHALLRSF